MMSRGAADHVVPGEPGSFVREHLSSSLRAMEAAAASEGFHQTLISVADAMTKSLRAGHKLLFAGNGGSAGDAQHIAGEFLSRLNFDRSPLAAIALSVDTSVLTAIANDYGYELVFERQVQALGRNGDVFVGISTSGQSPNILRALEAARSQGLCTVGLTGQGQNAMLPLCDLVLAAPSRSTPLIQQIHIVAAHVICGLVERALFQPDS